MIQYFDNYDLACVDGYSFRRDKKTGYYLSSIKIGDKRMRLHVYVWEKANGKLPKGYSVHHKDKNKRNNEIENLELLTKKEHAELHGRTMSEERRKLMAKNVMENAMPKAKAWHGTSAGIQWHRDHAKDVWEKAQLRKYLCTFCGEEFETKNSYSEGSNTFCSNKCKAAFRRASGVDDITKICERCGNEYRANKYQKTKYCPNCKDRKNTRRSGV